MIFKKCVLFFGAIIFSMFGYASYFPMYSSWPQLDGLGSPVTLTYSYSNWLDGSIIDSTTGESMSVLLMRNIFETALWSYANVLPIHFIEVPDNAGPMPETGEYSPDGWAYIRVGQVPHIDDANAYAYFPFEGSGLAGDIVFNTQRFGSDWTPIWLYAVVQHELGHSLGMGHAVEESVVSQSLDNTASNFGNEKSFYQGPLFPITTDMLSALQGVYGVGIGSVTPVPAPASIGLFIFALSLLRLSSLRIKKVQ